MRTDMGVLIALFVLQCKHKLGKCKIIHHGRRCREELKALVLGLGQRSVPGPLVKDRLSVSRAEQVVPDPEVMFPKVGEYPLPGPHPMMIPEPEP